MAATAEALMDSLSGGSDASTGDADVQQPGNKGDDGAEISAGDAPAESEVPAVAQLDTPNPPAASDGAKPDQVANLNAAIRETRTENKALKAQLQELNAKIEALAKGPAPAAEVEAEPDFLADPKGYVDASKKKLADLEAKLEADKTQQSEQQKQQQQAQETWNKVLASEAEFAAATPDYHDALNHVRGIRAEQIKIEIRETEDREATTEEIGQILARQEAQGAAALVAKGKNPSKFYYEYAKTFGYKPKAATTAAPVAKPDKDAVRTMGSGGGSERAGGDEPEGALGILAAAQSEHRAQFKRRK